MLVQHYLENSAEKYPDKTALVCGGRRLSYADIDHQADRLAQALIQKGINRADRVVIYLQNSVESVISIFATLKAMGVFVVVNPTTKKDKLIYIMNNCRAAALITSAGSIPILDEVQQKVSSLKSIVLCSTAQQQNQIQETGTLCSFTQLLEESKANRPLCRNIDQDLACLIYTSGSTGDPKGVMSGHNNVNFASGSIITYLENTPEDIIINVLPLSFDYGLYQLLMAFRFSGTLVLEKSFTYPAQVLNRIEQEQVTGFPGVPTMFSILVQMDISKFNLKTLRYMTNTAAALPPDHILELRSKFPLVTIYSMYGLTECKRTLYLPPQQLDKKPGSVGIAIPGTEVWLEDDQGNRLGPNQTGELVIRGSHVMRGYWENPTATQKVYKPGPTVGERVLYSGDLFKMDEDGYLYFVSRKDDIIKSRGEKVAPKEVESVIYSLKGVVEAAVVGIPDTILGQAIKAFVVSTDPALDENTVKHHCSRHLEDFMVPHYVEFRKELPKTSSGKIRAKDLK
ncbi:MAG: class I adenylate-forming enzyme family protein [Spirochaetota bacterium]